MYYVITAIVFFVVGYVVGFFVMRKNPKYFDIDDVLKGKRDDILEKLKELKRNFEIDVMVGTIATEEAAQDLINAGADGLVRAKERL